jgi:hypothetical protein
MTDQREPPLDDRESQVRRRIGALRHLASTRSAKRAGALLAILIGVAYALLGPVHFKHASTPVKILAAPVLVVVALLELMWLFALGLDAAKEVRDWLWLRREDWRDWRSRHKRA